MKNSNIKILILLLISIGVIYFAFKYIFFRSDTQKSTKAAGETVSLSFNPASSNLGVNAEETIVVKVKPSIEMLIRGYLFNISFNKTKIEIKDISYKIGSASVGLGQDNGDLAVVNNTGLIKVWGQINTATGRTLTTTETDIITFKVKSKSTEPSNIMINKNSIKFIRIMSNMNLVSVPGNSDKIFKVNGGTLTSSPSPTPIGGIDAKVNFKLKFQGIAKKPKDKLNKLKVRLRLYDENTEKYADVDVDNFTAGDNGVWIGKTTFTGVLSAHKYTLLVKGPYHIQKKVCVEKPTETSPGSYLCIKGNIVLTANNEIDLTGILFMVGDLPVQDGIVNAYDTSLIRNNLGKSTEEAIAKADVNRDGVVDTQDWSLVIAALSIRSDEL